MRVHHLNCISACPLGGKLMDGSSHGLRGRFSCHCLLVETPSKLVLVDTRPDSPTNGAVNEFFIGSRNPMIVQVPNLVYHGWKCISTEPSMVVNVTTEPYQYAEPDEFRLDPHDTLPYDWTRKDG